MTTPKDNTPAAGQQTQATPTPEQQAAALAAQQQADAEAARKEQEKREQQAAAEAKKADSAANKATEKAAKLRAEAEKALQEAEEAERAAAELNGKADSLAAEAPIETVDIKFADVIVMRDDKTELPTQVFEHEVPILQQLHGLDFVRVTGVRSRKVANFDAATELERLKRKYKVAGSNPKGTEIVHTVYRSAEELAKAAGVKVGRGTARKPPQSVQSARNEDKVIGARA